VRAERLVEKSIRLRPWLTTVARNAAIDSLRSDRATDSVAPIAAVPSDELTPEGAAIAADAKTELTAALAALSAQQRAAIELVYFADLTYAAAAEKLGEPVGTIKSRVHLAMSHLRARLETPGR
jgi:RNA polymerase sigma-70 factor (ECF subfamily)